MAVLVLTHPLDITVDPVIKHLHDTFTGAKAGQRIRG